ncbi:MAG TPA: VWA domain-containing protein, partial [Bacteroidales bacterium]|nr:VWA domain-containing protein [Bacteroidales bacterium]
MIDENILPIDSEGNPVTRWIVPNPTLQVSTKSASLAKFGTTGLKAATTSLEWPNPGSIYIDKSSEATDTEGLWKINILVEGKNISTTSDVVLVIDNSLSMSMNGSTRMADAIDAANTFVDQLLTGSSENIRIAVVTINDASGNPYPQTVIGFSSNTSSLHTAINSIQATGYTNLQGGFHEARTLLNTSSAQNKVIVFMSDGEPNKSYESVVTSSVTPQIVSCDKNGADWDISSTEILDYLTVISSNYGVVVGSTSFNYNFYSISEQCTYSSKKGTTTRNYTFSAGNHGITTIYEANLAISEGYDIYTIGFDISSGSEGESVLMQSQNQGYYPANSSNISQIYSEIGSNIAYAATNAVFTDPMSGYVVLQTGATPSYSVLPDTSGDVVVSKGSVTFSNVGYVLNDPDDPNSGNSSYVKWQINWNIGTVSESGDEMYYYVAIAPNTDPTLLYDANEQTYIDYIDVDGNPAHKQTSDDFTIPKVSGGKGSILMHFFLVNENGDPINSNGQIVSSEVYAYPIPQDGVVTSLYNINGVTALDLNTTYNITPVTTYNSSNGKSYVVHSDYSGTQSLTLTTSQPNQSMWIGYTEYVCATTAKTISAEGCESVTVNDSVYTETGVYTQNLTNNAGCDSTLTVNVTILEPTTETISAKGC